MMPRRNHKKSRDVFIRESQVIPLEEFRKLTNMYHNLDQVLKNLFNFKSTIPHFLVMGDQDHLFLNPAKQYVKTHQNSEISIFENIYASRGGYSGRLSCLRHGFSSVLLASMLSDRQI